MLSKVEIIIPIFNDFESLQEITSLIYQGKEEFEKKQISFLLIDNGSTDERITKFGLGLRSPLRMERLDQNLGFGGGIFNGVVKSHSDWVGWMPGNLRVNPILLLSLLEDFTFHAGDIIKCKRKGRRVSGVVKTWIMGAIQSIYAWKNMMDTGGTPTICEKQVLLKMPDPPTSVVFESFVLYWAQSFRLNISRPKIDYGERKYGSSHWQKGLRSELLLAKEILSEIKVWKKVESESK